MPQGSDIDFHGLHDPGDIEIGTSPPPAHADAERQAASSSKWREPATSHDGK